MHTHLTQYHRVELSLLIRLGYSQRGAARELGVHPSTVSRELRRNGRSDGTYRADTARVRTRSRRAGANAARMKLLIHPGLAQAVEARLRANWSPEQIAGRFAAAGRKFRVCTQTIYDWLYRYRRDLLGHLHCRKGKYRRTRENTLRRAFRDQCKERRRITARPAHIARRSRYGHWEGDTIVGKGRGGYIATFVERKSGYVVAVKLERATADAFRRSIAALDAVSDRYRKTLTLDNGTEMAEYEGMEREYGLSIYFAHPYHSWERGTNENTNGLLRFYFPKQADLSCVTQTNIDRAVHELNTRPRKRLGYRTPEEVFTRNW